MAKTWFITGASRGLGLEIAKAALRAGHRVVATGRKGSVVRDHLGPDGDHVMAAELDVTEESQARRLVEKAVKRFGALDVLVNNAGYGHLGFFEETSHEDAAAQFATNVFGVFHVTRAALPVMRAAHSGRIFNISSVAGFRGSEFGSLYSASKFALEGFSEALAQEVAPFGIAVTIVEPGPFRTDFLTSESLRFGSALVSDYDDRRARVQTGFEQRSGKQPGDPAKLGDALVRLAGEANPPLRFAAGAFAIGTIERKLAAMKTEFDAWRELAAGTDF